MKTLRKQYIFITKLEFGVTLHTNLQIVRLAATAAGQLDRLQDKVPYLHAARGYTTQPSLFVIHNTSFTCLCNMFVLSLAKRKEFVTHSVSTFLKKNFYLRIHVMEI